MPPRFWAEALNTATYLLNRRPCHTSTPRSPHALLLGIQPDYSLLQVFGCLCFPNLTSMACHKLDHRSTPCVFLGHPSDHCGYRCFHPLSRRVFTSWHVIFHETAFPFATSSAPAAPSPSPLAASPSVVQVLAVSSPAVVRALPASSIATVGSSSSGSAPYPACTPAGGSNFTDRSGAHGSRAPGSIAPSHGSSSAFGSPSDGLPASLTSTSPPGSSPSSSSTPTAPAAPVPPAAPSLVVTRAQRGIFRPNPRYYDAATATASPPVSPVPSSVRVAVRDPHWFAAMRD